MEPEFLTVREVADHLRVTKATVIRMIKAGALDAIRPGKAYRIRASAYRAFLESRTEGA